jgi:hypothetical protein
MEPKAHLNATLLLVCVCWGLLCSCATPEPARPTLPSEALIDDRAGKGCTLVLKVSLENSQELILGVDTGSAYTVLDKSLEPKLGQRLGTATIPWLAGNVVGGLYLAPTLRFGNTQLLTAPQIRTVDMTNFPDFCQQGLTGILGIDCLEHYCIQLDFVNHKLRFLDPVNMNTEGLGRAFHLIRHRGCFAVRENFSTNWRRGHVN